jgi:protein-tyrosine phosphatase
MSVSGGVPDADPIDYAATRVPIPGTDNVRDLGGYPTAGGQVVSRRRLYRAQALVHPQAGQLHAVWDAAHARHYRDLGVRTVIDLRSADEASRTPSAWAAATGAALLTMPIAEGGEGTDTNYVRLISTGQMARFTAEDMAGFYCEMLDRRADVLAGAVSVLASATRLPVLAHCSAGKDRTGIYVALVLEVLGVPRPIVVRDYALTGVLRPNRVAAYAEVFAGAGVALDDVRTLFETPAAAMEAALAHLDRRYGGAADYLRSGGLAGPNLDRIRGNLLSPPDPAG